MISFLPAKCVDPLPGALISGRVKPSLIVKISLARLKGVCNGYRRIISTSIRFTGLQRKTNYFGKLGYEESGDDHTTPIEETLAALGELVKQGKVRHIGISNETPWGVTQYLNSAREQHLPRILSIQNPYNLLNRSFEVGLAEISHREKVGLLAYSPLGFRYAFRKIS